MSSPEPRLKPDHKIQVNDAAGLVQPAGSESQERSNTNTASHAESLLAAEKRTLEMIADGANIKDILNELCSSIDVEVSPVISTVLLMDPDGERLWHTAGTLVPRDWLPVISPLPISPHAGCCGAAALLKERVIVADVTTDINWLDEYRDLAIKNGIRAAWSEPILTKEGEVLGTFALYSSEARIPADAEIELIEGAGHIALIAIERQRSHRALEEALVEIKNSENKLRTIIDTIPALAWSARPDGSAEFFNRRWLDYAGLSAEEAADWGWTVALHPEDRARLMDYWGHVLASGETGEIEARVRRADGEYCWWFIRNVPLRDETGKLVRWYGTAIDIEDRKRAEQALRKSEERWRSVFENSAIGVALTDLNGRFLATNHVYQTIVGYTEEELRALYFLDVTHEDHREANWALITELLEGKRRQFQIEKKYRRKDGSSIWVSNNVSLVPGTERVPRFIMTLSEDITQRKRAEDALRASEASLLEAQRLTRSCSWKHEILSGKVTISPEGLPMYGTVPEDDASTADFYFRRMHPEDRPLVEQAYATALLRKTDFEADFRIVHPDGTIKNARSIGHPVLDERGEVVEFVGASIDVTEHHRARADLEKAFEEIRRLRDQLHDENLALREQIDQAFMFEEIVGSSPALQAVLSSIVKVAPTDSTVLITGETGTGKELIARAIHKHSQRSGQAFISVNCASIPSSLIASELFGHEKGAFTGAVQRRQGRFELAHSGTIFLDEVGDLPAETQITLLRVLQERQFERVGGNRIIPTDVRVIAATNRDLTAAIAAGTFRADLFYRLNVFPIEVPPLRKRKEDIPMLVEYFVKRYAEKAGKHICKIDNHTLARCQSYAWPGNIRELQNIVERSVILCSGDTFWIEKAWLASVQPPRQELAGPLPDTLQNQEREIIETALAESKGKVAGPEGAAAKLGIPRSTLDSKIKQLRIKKHRFISE